MRRSLCSFIASCIGINRTDASERVRRTEEGGGDTRGNVGVKEGETRERERERRTQTEQWRTFGCVSFYIVNN